MDLLVIRHAVAEDKKAWARAKRDDRLRPLTAEGAREMRAAARGLRRIQPKVDRLVSSPLTRALETAEIVAREYSPVRIEQSDTLEPDRDPDELLRWLRKSGATGVVAIVGHEPHLGALVTVALSKKADESRSAMVEMDKGGACLLSFPGRPRASRAMLEWLMTRAQLRGLRG